MIRLTLAFLSICTFAVFGQNLSSSAVIGLPQESSIEEEFLNAEDYIPVRNGPYWGWYDIGNDFVDTLKFTDFAQPKSGYVTDFVLKKNSHWGIMNPYDIEIVPFVYDSILYFEGQLITLSDGTWNYHHRTDMAEDDSLIPIFFDSVFFNNVEIYLFDKGKTGVILPTGTVIQPKYDGIQGFSCDINSITASYYLTLSGEEYNLLDASGKEILPKGVWDVRCTEDDVIEFKRGEESEFYNPYFDEFLRPNGRDVIFYGKLGYKIYNREKTKSEFHFAEGQVLKDQFDDYFYLRNDIYAVRKNGKVGLCKNGTELISELKYDQINPIRATELSFGANTNYFKFYLGDACGLMDENGHELFYAEYANILTTSDPNRFIVLDQGLTGVVDRYGQIVVPVKYDHIYIETRIQSFVVQLNNKIGLFDLDGSMKIPVEYEAFRIFQDFFSVGNSNPLIGLKKNGNYFFANNEGFISKTGFNHYDHTEGVLKTYDSKAISVFVFNAQGQVEEKQEYPIFNNAIVEEDNVDLWSFLIDWEVSELEENQQEGYFGLRYYDKRGFGVNPVYRTIQSTVFGDFIGKVGMNSQNFNWIDSTEVKIVRCFDHLKTGDGGINTPTFFQSDLLLRIRTSGDRHVNRSLGGRQTLSYVGELGSPTMDISNTLLFSESDEDHKEYIKYFSGGRVELCSINEAKMSLYDYFRYSNSLHSLKASPSLMKRILNPKLGVRFVDTEVGILNSSFSGVPRKHISFEPTKFCEAFYFLGPRHYLLKELDESEGIIQATKVPENENDEVKMIKNVTKAEEVRGYFGDFILAQIKNGNLAKIHTDYPGYYFVQDSVNLSYEAGRIIKKIDSNFVRLISPNGLTIADSCVLVRYLNEERFAILKSTGWEVIDKNGRLICDQKLTSVSNFKNQQAELVLKDGSNILVNADGEEVMPLPEPRIFLDDDHYYFANNPTHVIDRISNSTDVIQKGEKYLSNGLFSAKKDGKTRLRRFGSEKTVQLKTTSKLKSFGSRLYFKKGKHHYSIDSNLIVAKHKKVNKLRPVTSEIAWLEGKKDELIDFNWERIHMMSKNECFEMRDGNLYVYENDSVYTNFGSVKAIAENESNAVSNSKIEIVSKNGKYGVVQGDEVILPFSFSWLSKINDREFMTKIDSECQLFNSSLDRVGDQPFDWFIQTEGGNFVFYGQEGTSVVSEDRKSSRIVRMSR